MSQDLVALLYLVSGVLFILALRGLSSPETSRQGNFLGIAGMALAIVTTLASHPPAGIGAWLLVVLGLTLGGGAGAVIARRVRSEEHTSELQSQFHLVCRLLLEKKKKKIKGSRTKKEKTKQAPT